MKLTTVSHRIWPLRVTGPEDTLLDLTSEGNFDNIPSTALDLQKDSIEWDPEVERQARLLAELEANGIEIYIAASNAHSQNLIWYLTAWRNENGPAKRVATGTATTGTQAVVKYPHNNVSVANMYWCDKMTITYQNWLKEVDVSDPDGNSNSLGSLWLDACGYRYWLLEVRTTEADATAATNVCAYYGRY